MKISRVLVSLLFLSLIGPSSVSAADKVVRLAADEWCPYNCSPDSKDRPGYMVEIAQKVFGKAGYTVQYKVMPYQRALQAALQGQIEGVLGMDADSAEDAETAYLKESGKPAKFIVPDKMGVSKIMFFVPVASTWQYDPAKADESLKALGGKAGIPLGYGYDITPLLQKHNMVEEVGGDTPMEQLLKMLDSGRVKAVIDDDKVINEISRNIGLAGKFHPAGNAEDPLDLYIGFGPAHQSLVDILNKGIEELRKNGELKGILQKYGIGDWQ